METLHPSVSLPKVLWYDDANKVVQSTSSSFCPYEFDKLRTREENRIDKIVEHN